MKDMDMGKGLADAVLSGSKKPEDEEESDPLETAVSEFFDSKDPKTRAEAFKAAVAMCSTAYDDDE